MGKAVKFDSVEEAFEAGVREGLLRHRLEARNAEADTDWEAIVDDALRITFGPRGRPARKAVRRGRR